MNKINFWAVIVAAVVAFVLGALWYGPFLFGKAYLEVRAVNPAAIADMRPPAWELVGEFAKNLVVAFVIAYFVVRLGVGDWKSALQLGLWIWVGFQAMLLRHPRRGRTGEDTAHDRDTRRLAQVKIVVGVFAIPPETRRT